MKVLQVLNHFLPFQTAGTEVYTWALSKELQKRGVEVKIVVPRFGEQNSDYYKYDELEVFQYAEPSIADRAMMMGERKPAGLVLFESYLEEQKPDIVHFHAVGSSNGITMQHMVIAKNKGAKVLMTFHLPGYSCITSNLIFKKKVLCDGKIDIKKCSSCYLHSKSPGALNAFLLPISSLFYQIGIDTSSWDNKIGTALATSFVIERLKFNLETLIRHCDQLIVLTAWYLEVLQLNGVSPQKISFLSQGLPTTLKNRATLVKMQAGKRLRLMFLGRISAYKGLHLLLQALIELPDDTIELDIYGQVGEDDYEMLWKQKTIGRKNIRWNGILKQAFVLSTMEQHDILCLCSTFSEMSPLVIQEAFAAGIPVLASNVYGNAEQIQDGVNGWLFKFNDIEDLKLKLQMLIDQPYLIKEAIKNLPAVKDFTQVAEEHEKLYNSLLIAAF